MDTPSCCPTNQTVSIPTEQKERQNNRDGVSTEIDPQFGWHGTEWNRTVPAPLGPARAVQGVGEEDGGETNGHEDQKVIPGVGRTNLAKG